MLSLSSDFDSQRDDVRRGVGVQQAPHSALQGPSFLSCSGTRWQRRRGKSRGPCCVREKSTVVVAVAVVVFVSYRGGGVVVIEYKLVGCIVECCRE